MSRFSQPECHRAEPIDPRLDGLLRHVIAIGAVLVLLLPAARGSHAVLGWLPLWLLAMPMVAWWALHRFPLPGWAAQQDRHVKVTFCSRMALPCVR
ncbi:MAG: hypothetical protein H0T88_05790 [Lysobacter sp.]|nr:hypothetical protein [Lysobacter sp.]